MPSLETPVFGKEIKEIKENTSLIPLPNTKPRVFGETTSGAVLVLQRVCLKEKKENKLTQTTGRNFSWSTLSPAGRNP
jgi:hypothetical protein